MKKIFTMKNLPLLAVLTSSFAVSVFADDNNVMDTVVVTASRTEQKLSDTLDTTTVISSDDIERIQPRDLTDLLRREVGIDYTRTGGRGATSSLFVRGTNANQVVFLVDGARVNTTSNGAASLELFDLENIDHIEVVRGPSSSLYGNDAIGGVIQIFTRKGKGEPSTTVKTSYGSNAESINAINTGGEINNTHYNVAASYESTNGINNTNKNAGKYIYDPDHDGYRNSSVAASLGHDFDGGHELGMTFSKNKGQAEFDVGELNFDTQVLTGYGKWQLRDNLDTKLTLTNVFDKQDTPAFSSYYNTHRNTVLSQTNWQVSNIHLLTAGAEYIDESLDTDQGYTNESRYSRGLFLQDQMNFGRHSLKLGARNDDSSQYSTENTWNAAYGFDLTSNLMLFANYGTAFKAPSFNDLYAPYVNYCAPYGSICANSGNPDLDPEKSRSGEIGLKFQEGSTYWSASAYETKIEDLIAWMPTIGPNPWDSTWAPDNISNAKIQGADFTAGTAIDEWRFATHASILNPVDEDTGKRLLRRSKHFMGVDIDRDIGESVSVGASWNAQGGRTDAGDEYDGGFNTVDLRSSYVPMKDLKLSFSINNIFDTDYTVAYGYETPGVNAMLTAAYTF
ncbi:MAG TPA: TonB-dependent receptor [Pseudomonadales bacterium]|nr:TonB-dependent receptor [Pseudomonadales bacterium]